ncbi:MAG: hypothetical protein JNM17_23825 [Archangium sp.]|nr:hypothetical protein [Archangium sp.]
MKMLLLVAVLMAPAAWASDFGGGGSDASCGASCATTIGVTVGITFGLDLIIDVVNLINFIPGGYLKPGWGILQGLWGLGHVALGGMLTGIGILAAILQSPTAGNFLGIGLVMLAEGIFLVVIAIASGVRFVQDKIREREERRHPAVPVVSGFIDPRGNGAFATLGWQF